MYGVVDKNDNHIPYTGTAAWRKKKILPSFFGISISGIYFLQIRVVHKHRYRAGFWPADSK